MKLIIKILLLISSLLYYITHNLIMEKKNKNIFFALYHITYFIQHIYLIDNM